MSSEFSRAGGCGSGPVGDFWPLPALGAAQQAIPTGPITIIVPAAAGGPTDTVARLIGESMGRTLGQQFVVENVGGAGGTIGMARVAKAAPDGYTLAVWHIAQATAPALYDNLQVPRDRRFRLHRPHHRRADDDRRQVDAGSQKHRRAAGLGEGRSRRRITYAHAGVGSASHLCALMFMSALKDARWRPCPIAARARR